MGQSGVINETLRPGQELRQEARLLISLQEARLDSPSWFHLGSDQIEPRAGGIGQKRTGLLGGRVKARFRRAGLAENPHGKHQPGCSYRAYGL